jgi:hypothetical protein
LQLFFISFVAHSIIMGLFGLGNKKDESKSVAELILDSTNNPDFVVPDHAKPKEVVKEIKPVVSKKNIFIIESIYDIGTQIMVSGVLESGHLKKGLKVKIRKKEIPISDLKVGTGSVKDFVAGERGTIFLRGKDLNILRIGDGLDFK